jgi:adenylate cyclase
VQALGLFEPIDRRLLDSYFLVRGDRYGPSPVVIVAIDYESLERAGHPWPWPRGVHARLIRKLAAAGAAVVAFDILFLDADPARDAELASAAEQAGNVVWASSFVSADQRTFHLSYHRPPVQRLQLPATTFGYVDLPFDPDGYVRRVLPFRHFGAQIFKSFSVVAAERYRRETLLHQSGGGIRWPGRHGSTVPVEHDGSLLINFYGPPASVPTVPYIRVLDGKVPPETFRDKIVLVGATVATDAFFTPFYSRLLPETGRLMPGVEIHANVVEMILRGDFLSRVSSTWNLLLFVTLGLGAGLLGVRQHPWLAVVSLAAAVVGSLVLGYLVFSGLNRWLAIAGPVMSLPAIWGALAAYGFVVERKEKNFVRLTLERYVSPAVVQEVIERGIDLALGGKRQTVTILFSDIRGFTGLSERIPPESVVEILSRHFAAASDIVLKHGGTLDKFIGDAVMAFWGAPAPHEHHAFLAVKAALEMQAAAAELDASLGERLGERFQIGIGINTGDAIVGHTGSPQRMGYTAVGDPVNLASRVEGMTGELRAAILITQFTYELVKFYVEAEPLGVVPVRGRRDPVAIYRLLGLKPTGPL